MIHVWLIIVAIVGLAISAFSLLFIEFLILYYGIKEAVSKKELEDIYRLRYEVYKNDLRMSFMHGSDDSEITQAKQIKDENDYAENTINIYAKKYGEVIGAVRITFYNNSPNKKMWKIKYGITKDLLKRHSEIAEISYLITKKHYRGKYLGIALMAGLYILSARKKIFPSLVFGYSMPGLLHYYQKITCYPYTTKYIYDNDGIAVPFVVFPYERKAGSSYYSMRSWSIYECLARYQLWKNKKAITPLNYKQLIKPECKMLPHLNLQASNTAYKKIIERAKNYKRSALFRFILSNIKLNKHLILEVEKSKKIILSRTTDCDIYLILQGKFLQYDGNVQIELKPGDTIGEVDHFHQRKERLFTVKSLSKGVLMLVQRSYINRLPANQKAYFYNCLSKDLYKKLCHAVGRKDVKL